MCPPPTSTPYAPPLVVGFSIGGGMLFLITIHTPAHTPALIHGTLDGIRTHVHRSKAYDVGPLHYKSTMVRGVTNGLPSRGPLDKWLTLLMCLSIASMLHRMLRRTRVHRSYTMLP